jgi:S1-C subfamily serine protease
MHSMIQLDAVLRDPDRPGTPISLVVRTLAFAIAAVLSAVAMLSVPRQGIAGDLREIVQRIKPSVVAVGSYQSTRRPPANLRGTGFVVADGVHVITNAHVLPEQLNTDRREKLAVFIGRGERTEFRQAKKVAVDVEHDIAVLQIPGPSLPALALGDDSTVRDGESVAFTGFPIAPVLGLYPVTHRGIVSSITPAAIAPPSSRLLDNRMIHRLEENYSVFQLDATAYPGNSGSPLYGTETGDVIGIVSSVFIKETKEKILQDPSGISYAIPIRYAKALLARAGVSP